MAQTVLRVLIFLVLLSVAYAAEDCPRPEGPKEEGCPVCGNGDFYGLGVRIGICNDPTEGILCSLCLRAEY